MEAEKGPPGDLGGLQSTFAVEYALWGSWPGASAPWRALTSVGELTGPESWILLGVGAGKERVDAVHLIN